jgi:uncharacterized LabA/DUF88 family protein
MKKVAILIDGEWFRRVLQKRLPSLEHGVTAEVMYSNAIRSLEAGEDLFRLFYYDCPPYAGVEENPISREKIDFKELSKSKSRRRFLEEMSRKPFVAMRLGVAKARGWALHGSFVQSAIENGRPGSELSAADVFVNIEQKGVDMRIGIDVSTLSLKRIVDRIILISGDTDMVPAIKLARREGVQVFGLRVNGCKISRELQEDLDAVREITVHAESEK